MPLGTWELLYVPREELTATTADGVTRYQTDPGALVQMKPADVAELAPAEETTLWDNP